MIILIAVLSLFCISVFLLANFVGKYDSDIDDHMSPAISSSIVYQQYVKDRHLYCAGSQQANPVSWWYLTGYADAKAGYGSAVEGRGTVHYQGASTEGREAYDLGYADGMYCD